MVFWEMGNKDEKLAPHMTRKFVLQGYKINDFFLTFISNLLKLDIDNSLENCNSRSGHNEAVLKI